MLLFSSEIPELVNLCHRVLVMYKGSVVLELAGDELDEEAIIRAALGEKANGAAQVQAQRDDGRSVGD